MLEARRVRRVLSVALALVAMGGATAARQAAHLRAGADPVAWRELDLTASKLLLGASSHVRLELVPTASVAGELGTVRAEDGVAASGPRVAVLSVDSDLPFGRDERTRIWLDPASGAALQFSKETLGRKPYRKVARYIPGGYHAHRWSPRDDREERSGSQAWSKRKMQTVRVEQRLPEGAVLTDSYALLYLLSAAGLQHQGRELHAYVISEEQMVRLVFTSREQVLRRVDFVETWAGGSRRRSGSVPLRRVTVTGSSMADPRPSADLDLGFLGMRGSITVFLEPETGVPVEISGNARHIGELTVRLARARLIRAPAGFAGASAGAR